jgi:hypothetical protein
VRKNKKNVILYNRTYFYFVYTSTLNDNDTFLLYKCTKKLKKKCTVLPFVHARMKQTKATKQQFFKEIFIDYGISVNNIQILTSVPLNLM